MGQSSQKLKVVSLNYSSIFVSPFQFYASDNWQQLQKIGIIFQENLKLGFQKIKQQISNPADVPREDFYMRKNFDWKIDKLDKIEKYQRYSPLYIGRTDEEYLQKNNYPGITEDYRLMNEQEYFQQWSKRFRQKQQKYHQTEVQMCKRFDFECYRAFIQYLYNLPENTSQFTIEINRQRGQLQNFGMAQLDEIVISINKEPIDRRRVVVQIYRKFMHSYFSRIDGPSKVKITIRQLFQKNEFDIICLQETNLTIVEQIKKQNNYYVFVPPFVKDVDDQCILIINKSCKLIPNYYHQYHRAEQESIEGLTKNIIRSLQSQNAYLEWKDQLKEQIRKHFNEEVAQNILKKAQKIKDLAKIQDLVFSFLMNPLKLTFSTWFEPYRDNFLAYWEDIKSKVKPESVKLIISTLEQLQENGLFYDSSAFTITTFKYTNKQLQQYQDSKDPLVVISLHFTSKEVKNKIQVQILGIFMYELIKNGYKFILSGDYNSFIDIKDREDEKGPFIFLRSYYRSDQSALKLIEDLQSEKTIHVFPKHPMIHTTKKKRTILQVQARKINTLAAKCIDQIISNFPILYDECYTGQICHLNSSQNRNKVFIPNICHPYDHFAVEAIISVAPPTNVR